MTVEEIIFSVLNWITSRQTLSGIAIPVVMWLGSKFVDAIAQEFFSGKIIAPALQSLKWRIRAFRTRLDKLSCEFVMSYTPDRDITLDRGKTLVEESITDCTKRSKNRIEESEISWTNSSNAHLKLEHIDSDLPFEFEIYLVETRPNLPHETQPSEEDGYIDKISIEVEFKFAYRDLSDTLSNLNTTISILTESFDEIIGGRKSSGKFILEPIEGGLKVDEWIREEGLDVTTKLHSTKEERTQVDFFRDRAEVNTPYLQMDTEVERYIRIILLDYYLKS